MGEDIKRKKIKKKDKRRDKKKKGKVKEGKIQGKVPDEEAKTDPTQRETKEKH